MVWNAPRTWAFGDVVTRGPIWQPQVRDNWRAVAASFPLNDGTAINIEPDSILGGGSGNKIAAIPAPDTYSATILADTPVGYWRLGESSGDAIDDSGNGNDGTVTGATQGATGLLGDDADTAYSFDGASGNVDMGSPAVLDDLPVGGFTVEAWIKASSDGENDQGAIACKGLTGWRFFVIDESAGAMRLGFLHWFNGLMDVGQWRTTSRDITVGQTHHVVVTYDNSSAANDPIMYIDGVSVAFTETTTPVGAADSDAANTFRVGNVQDASTFDGTIDEVAVYSSILTADQIMHHHMVGVGMLHLLKGQLMTSNGTLRTAQSIGSNGNLLIADSSAANGIRWTRDQFDFAEAQMFGSHYGGE